MRCVAENPYAVVPDFGRSVYGNWNECGVDTLRCRLGHNTSNNIFLRISQELKPTTIFGEWKKLFKMLVFYNIVKSHRKSVNR